MGGRDLLEEELGRGEPTTLLLYKVRVQTVSAELEYIYKQKEAFLNLKEPSLAPITHPCTHPVPQRCPWKDHEGTKTQCFLL